MAREAEPRRQVLLALEVSLGLDSPAEIQSQRLALQVMQLKDRFKGATAAAESAGEQLFGWCARPGVAAELDRQRCERIFSRIGTTKEFSGLRSDKFLMQNRPHDNGSP